VSTTAGKSETVQIELEIARAKSGDADACAALFEAYKQHVYALCLRATGDIEEAEELTQEVFVQVFRKLSTFRGDSNFSAWLYPIVVKAVSTHLERKSNRDVVFDQPLVKPLRVESPDKRDMTVPAIITLGAFNDDPVAAPALAMLDVLGEPVLLRAVQCLRDAFMRARSTCCLIWCASSSKLVHRDSPGSAETLPARYSAGIQPFRNSRK